MTIARFTGAFLLNLILAMACTNALTSAYQQASQNPRFSQIIVKTIFLSGLSAFGLGCFVYRTWRSTSAKWIWVAGLVWFGYGAIQHQLEQPKLSVLVEGRSTFWGMAGVGCDLDVTNCRDWAIYTLQFLRTACYSAGAVFWAAILNRFARNTAALGIG
jgi:hypothetical protein